MEYRVLSDQPVVLVIAYKSAHSFPKVITAPQNHLGWKRP